MSSSLFTFSRMLRNHSQNHSLWLGDLLWGLFGVKGSFIFPEMKDSICLEGWTVAWRNENFKNDEYTWKIYIFISDFLVRTDLLFPPNSSTHLSTFLNIWYSCCFNFQNFAVSLTICSCCEADGKFILTFLTTFLYHSLPSRSIRRFISSAFLLFPVKMWEYCARKKKLKTPTIWTLIIFPLLCT